jgi:threonyl-tRNA synthetase
MKILTLHVDYINFKPLKKALKSVEELSEKEKKGGSAKDALVVLTAIEKIDDNVKEVTKKFIEAVKDVASQVKTNNIVLYPYAHLSSNLASPALATEVLNNVEKELKKDFSVLKAPFGYYKEFEMKVKGHPLSELSREIRVEGEGKEKEEKIDTDELLRKMTKVHMSAPKGEKGLKSNVEIGRDLDLYIVSEIVGKGLPLLTPKGTTIKREIERFVTDEELKRGYLHTSTPVMASSDLYKISGHWQHYRDSMFVLDVRGDKFALRPMTCPFQFILYKSKPRSYKELPIRYAEIATLFRNEKTGELRGLTRIRQFTLADAHIICAPEQIEEEFVQVLDLIKYVMNSLGVSDNDIWYRFSKWNPKDKEKYIDNPAAWESSQKLMKKILDKLKMKYIEADGEAAFYGPKLDLQYKDVYGKEDTLFTVQIDFALPERYDMTYKDKNNKQARPMVIHRSSTGATERMIAFLLERNQGNLPVWLSPIQVKTLSLTERNIDFVKKLNEQLVKEGIRTEIDIDESPISGRIREASLMKIPYLIVIGDKEEKEKKLAVRDRTGKNIVDYNTEEFIKKVKEEIKNRKS